MADPVLVQRSPYIVDLEPGTYWWCACGKSQKQPFCDGSHKGGEFSPVKFEVQEKSTMALCGCKRSGNKPYCDGTHNKI